MKLTSKLIKQLNGKPIRLTSEYSNGRLLSVNYTGELSLQDSDLTKKYDQFWKLIPNKKGFLISSKVANFTIRYDPSGNDVKVATQAKDDNCSWKVGVGGEFYQPNPDGGERYLWVADRKIYSTFDGYLAEKWTPLDIGDTLPGIYTEKYGKSSKSLTVAILVIIAFLVLYLIWNRSDKSKE
jgi:hypothetical protein